MGKMKLTKPILAGAAVVTAVAFAASAFALGSKPVYLLSKNSAVDIKTIATVGDAVTGTMLRGIPDGMGAYDNGRGGITLLSVHEVATNAAQSIKTKSLTGPWGTSITKFTVSKTTKAVTKVEDFIQKINFYNYTTGKYQDTPLGAAPVGATPGFFDWGINRFCSATYAPAGTFIHNGVGYEGGLFFSGEESGEENRGFAFDEDGIGYTLPRMGMYAFENIMPSLKPGANTVVIGSEDGSATDSQLYVYAGKKQSTGTAIEKAGLTNGDLHVMNIPTIKSDNLFRTTVGKNKKVPVEFVKVDWNNSPTGFSKESREKGTAMARVEDGHWDPTNPNVFYFVTTESNKDPIATAPNPALPTVPRDGGGLWRLTFKDAQNPAAGAELEMLLNGGESVYMVKPDNITVTEDGKYLLLQEDPGGNESLARIIAYRVSDGKLAVVAQFDPNKFLTGGSEFMTNDEEASGIIDATKLLAKPGDKNAYFFLNAQIHTKSGAIAARPDLAKRSKAQKEAIDLKTVEGGQFYVMTISNWDTVFNG
jgi:hypothetical protein